MTKKHFEALAEALCVVKPVGMESAAGAMWLQCVDTVADTCKSFNPSFDRSRFLRACGVEG